MTNRGNLRVARRSALFGMVMAYAGGLSARGLEVIGRFGFYALAASRLGAHDSGLFFLCLNWINIASTASRMGLERATIRHMAAEIGVGRGRSARKAAITSFTAVTMASLAGAALTVIVARPASLYLFHQPDLIRPLALAAAILPAQTMAWAVAFILVGLDRGSVAQLVLSALPPTLTFLALLAGVRTTERLLLAFALANGMCCVFGLLVIAHDAKRKLVDVSDKMEPAHEPLPSLWSSARPFYVVEMVQILLISLPPLALGVFANPVAVGEFSIASRLSYLISTIISSIGTMISARFAALYRTGALDQLRQLETQARKLTFGLCLPVTAIMLLFPVRVLRLLGSEFGAAWPVLVILAASQLINSFWPFQDSLLAMIGAGAELRRLSLIQLTLCLAFTIALIPILGGIGAALAVALPWAFYVYGCKRSINHRLYHANPA